MLGIFAALATARAAEIIFPNDPRAVIDVKRDCGAKGDGIADDTAALQSAIERTGGRDHSRFIYLPNGTYRLTRALVLKPPGAGKEKPGPRPVTGTRAPPGTDPNPGNCAARE